MKAVRHSPKTQDTSDTINLPNLPEGACLVTADVVSTYNNIPHREDIETRIQHIKNNIALLPENSPRPGTIQSFLNIILTNSHFQYDDMFFQQTMETICASPNTVKQWVKKNLTALARLLGKLASKALAILPTIIGSIVSWLLNILKKVVGFAAEYTYVFITFICGILGYWIVEQLGKKKR